MFEKIEKFRTSDNGKTVFYILLGIAVALAALILARPVKLVMFNGNNNGNGNTATTNNKE